MPENEQTEIGLNKIKLLLMLCGSVAFVCLGIWLVTKRGEISAQSLRYSPGLLFIAGAASILFFGGCMVFITKKMFSNQPGIIINKEGINDNSGGVSAGLILWKDITGIKKISVANQNFIMIIVNNPKEYINKQTGFIKRIAMGLNFRNYGSPISISANGLKCNFDDLYGTLTKKCNFYKYKDSV